MDIKDSLKTVIDFLDNKMQESPDRETADTCNYLSDLLKELEEA